jgi:anti-anti-sigma factor
MAYIPSGYGANLDSVFDADELETTAGAFILDDAHPLAAIVSVFGEATFADTVAFNAVVVAAIALDRLVVVDMRECTYMDCAAIGVIVHAAKDLRDGLRLVLPSGSQGYRMLDVTGLTRALHVFDTVEAALKPIFNPPPRLRAV